MGGFSSDIGKRIRDRREALGIRAEDLADQIGMDRATYYRYEGGKLKNMKFDKIRDIAKALGIHPDDLVVWDEEKPTAEADDELKEMISIFSELNSDNRSKLLELCHLFLDAQHKTEEKK